MTCPARRCNTMLLEGCTKEKAVITSSTAEYGEGERGKGMVKICEIS